ncbi:MAG: hypothetical protein COW24_00805 [Candidatus Kerfeldbacteria bacterium CG15_BIG_FIL_POST_REV_8_21_14_020_45_12]|uniref:Uncharacterized protein n=1 Tax=Candidatus Kerfeldbacteria bacterium CG15_BIG_FIL_POST_REV_8_21_14_020_45_12 TaxID=2014247 RepID=A0A2M7H503_9BACT|nr:MAG: hypothetical protein COW24_00805 [Candidatus Kerfeldbacteria bacterium CG15_BIG_FIL_POST_REV_8_21_14_020_45_12]PJA93182.1 MAG: hypothetical protein CO132_04340 [Candidatus Kerfeldbacteria bacterium CG_4_9_14_3_um_filter_45_8]
MNNISSRSHPTKLSKLVMIAIFVPSVVAPLFVALVWTPLLLRPLTATWVVEFLPYILWFYFIPVFAVYAGIIFFRFYPKRLQEELPLLVPIFISIASLAWYHASLAELPQQLYAQGAPYIIGLAIDMIIGLAYLAKKKMALDELGRREAALSLLVLATISIPWLIGLIAVAVAGWQAWLATTPVSSTSLSGLLYTLNIAIISFVYFHKLAVLYREGRL